jgi:asparagine synthase (glutamine-hydrolysing)
MCGIFALFLKHALLPENFELGRKGIEMLHHRGPDGTGEWYDDEAGVFLAHKRLAIIDLSAASAQPFKIGKLNISYNGEVYNFQELRKSLQSLGQPFETTGDVEVLLKAWAQWGPNALDKLDAMFAFALWDGKDGYLATDAFGEKPLFYAERPEGVYVSSEIQPLAKLLELKPSFGPAEFAGYMSLGYVVPPATIYKAIKRVPAATLVKISHGQISSVTGYWTPPRQTTNATPPRPLNEGEIDEIQSILIESIRRRLLADAPLCLFLSSGVDSSLVASIAAKELKTSLNCLTVSFPQQGVNNEAEEAAAIAGYLGLDHEVIVNPTKASEPRGQGALNLFGQPADNMAAISIYQMSLLAAEKYKVAITGIGGDEVFMGYGKHAYFYDKRKLYAMPEAARLIMGRVAKLCSRLDGRLSRLAYDIGVRNSERYIANKIFPSIFWLKDQQGFDEWVEKTFSSSISGLEELVANFELMDVMPGSKLPAMDAASMRASLELRTPFLSRALVEAVADFDPRAFTAFGQKSVLRRILARYLPRHLWDHPKSGFSYPVSVFLSEFSETPPVFPGLSMNSAAELWRRRTAGSGWTRLAVRQALAAEFFQTAQHRYSED